MSIDLILIPLRQQSISFTGESSPTHKSTVWWP